MDLARLGLKITKIHPRLELPQRRIGRNAFNLSPVSFFQLVTRVGNLGLERSIVGQHDQTFGISIETTGGINLGNGQVIRQSRSPSRIGKLGQHPIWLIEQDEAAQTGQLPPKTLQNLCSSG